MRRHDETNTLLNGFLSHKIWKTAGYVWKKLKKKSSENTTDREMNRCAVHILLFKRRQTRDNKKTTMMTTTTSSRTIFIGLVNLVLSQLNCIYRRPCFFFHSHNFNVYSFCGQSAIVYSCVNKSIRWHRKLYNCMKYQRKKCSMFAYKELV